MRWTEDVKRYASPHVLKLLVGNKKDLEQEKIQEVSLAEARSCAAHYNMIDALETSAKVISILGTQGPTHIFY